MLSFKQFLIESQFMYHGTPNTFDTLTPNRDSYMINDAIGTHFASDPTLSNKFASGLYTKKSTDPIGYVFKTKAPPRSVIEKVPQKTYYKIENKPVKESDQHAIATHIAHTVFSQPENKQLFIDWLKHTRNTSDEDAERIHSYLSQNKPLTDNSFGVNKSRANTFRSFVSDFGGMNDSKHKKRIVDSFLDIMKKRGIKGLSYINTSPNETRNIRSPKCYILFDPSEHDHPFEKSEHFETPETKIDSINYNNNNKKVNEKMEDYRSGPFRIKRNKMSVSSYDTDYYDKVPDTEFYRSDETNKPYAFRHKLIPKREIKSAEDVVDTSNDVIHRGISHKEYQNILKTGMIKSKGSGNLGTEQEGLTYFTTNPSAADSYANMFSMKNKSPTPEAPPYIISIKRPHESKIKKVPGTGEHEIGVMGSIPADQITAVYRGNVINHTKADNDIGIKVAPMSRLHWEKIK